jgi:hypothetical protein
MRVQAVSNVSKVLVPIEEDIACWEGPPRLTPLATPADNNLDLQHKHESASCQCEAKHRS